MILLFCTIFILACIVLIRRKQCLVRANLPPGSMGWPYIGETFSFYSQNPNQFFTRKQKRYGEIFKTHLLGYRCVMLASPEASRFVLVSQSNCFKPTYPKSKMQLIGPSALFFHQGEHHVRLRKLVQGPLSPESMRRLIPGIDAIAVSALDSWIDGCVINTFQEMKKFTFNVGILSIFGQLEARYTKELKKNYTIVEEGYNSFPTSIPGTLYNNAVLARRRLSKIVSEIICERRETRFMLQQDILSSLMDYKDDNGQTLNDEQIADNIIGVLFAAQDTTASVLTWIIKYLHDDPKLLESLTEEQRVILAENDEGRRSLTWSQTRSMPRTHKVILESLRMASIIGFTFREAVADVEYKGYLIPKGWKVMPLFRNIHHNPEFYPDPHKFDPSRFHNPPKPNTFMPFGNGVHSCPGNEAAKLEILIFLHHLVTKFRWELEVVGSENEIQYCPFPVPKHGQPARFWKLPISNQNLGSGDCVSDQ